MMAFTYPQWSKGYPTPPAVQEDSESIIVNTTTTMGITVPCPESVQVLRSCAETGKGDKFWKRAYNIL
jgi:hypothetical protein